MNKWKVAIFDWNGTLCDDFPIVYKVVQKIFSHFGIKPPTPTRYRNEIEADFIRLYHNYGIPSGVTADYLNDKFRRPILQLFWNRAKLQNGARYVLSNCKKLGFECAIISGEMAAILKKRLVDFKIAGYFDYVAADAYKIPKTD